METLKHSLPCDTLYPFNSHNGSEFSFKNVFFKLYIILLFPPQDLKLTFPVDNSLLTCYKDRESCVSNDLPTEVSKNTFLFGHNLPHCFENVVVVVLCCCYCCVVL